MSSRVDVNNSQEHHHVYQYVGPYRLEKTLGKGQTGKSSEFNLTSMTLVLCGLHNTSKAVSLNVVQSDSQDCPCQWHTIAANLYFIISF